MADADGTRQRFVVAPESAGMRLDQFLSGELPDVSRSRIQRLIKDGHVTVSQGHCKPGLELPPGLAVEITLPPPEPASPAPEALPLEILHDDDDLVVVNKPAGMVVHPAGGHRTGTLVNALLHHVEGLSGIGGTERPGIVHRLDRGTSGLMVIAKHDKSHQALSAQFQARTVVKEYQALVWGRPGRDQLFSTPIGRDPKHRQRMSSRSRNPRAAQTRVIDVEALGPVSLVRVAIATGRTHQIRVHLSEASHPILGDALYGGDRRLPAAVAGAKKLERPFLHAARLEFDHPGTGERLGFDAPLPADLVAVLEPIRRGAAARKPPA